jgi:prolyl oligopeptidase
MDAFPHRTHWRTFCYDHSEGRELKRIAIVFALLAVSSAASAQDAPPKPPAAPVRPVTNEYFGVKVTDPYRYMENLKNPAVRRWIDEQGSYSRAVLNGIPGRAKLLNDVRALDESEPARVSKVMQLPNGRLFYLKEWAKQNAYVLCTRDGFSGKESPLVDPIAFDRAGADPATITFFAPSFDGQYVAFGISRGGTENTTIHVVSAQTGQSLPDAIPGVRFPVASWLPDGHSFLYNRLAPPVAGAPATEKYERSRVYLHQLGDDPAKDIPIFGAGVVPGLDIAADDIPWAETAPGSDYVVAVAEHGVSPSLLLYAAPLSSVGTPKAHWVRIGGKEIHVLDFCLRGDDLYLLVAGRSGPAIARVSLRRPAIGDWGLMLQLGADSGVTGMEAASDALYLTELRAGSISLVRVPYSAKQDIMREDLPFKGSVRLYPQDTRVPGALMMLSSWTRAPSIYRFEPKGDRVIHTDLWPAGPYDDPKDVIAVNATALGSDGALVPLTILYKKGTERDGTHPTLLMGYGSYSILLSPVFSPLWRVWLDRGGVLAFAHVRGGGEYGSLWRFEGLKVGLANRYHDFITCAQYLVDQGYTSPEHLAAMSGSAGAILVGGAITERPDLFRAVVIESGLLDLLRFQNTANGVMNVPEFGSTKTLEGFEDLYSVSSYDRVQPEVKYPAVLLEIGMNDPRVDPWQSAKMAARLQADSTSGLPVLLRVDNEVGHALASTAEQKRQLFTDEISFLFWQLGVPGFQPPAPRSTQSVASTHK